MHKKFTYPDYNNSIANIPTAIFSHFNPHNKKSKIFLPLLKRINGSSKVVLFLLDGFGYNLLEKQTDKNNFFKKIKQRGLVDKITTVFPTSTAAAITSLNSGLTPKEHGLLEWNMYFQELDLIIETLPYKIIPTEFQPVQPLPEIPQLLFNGVTIYEELARNNISSFFFVPDEYSLGIYNRAMSKGASIIPYSSLLDIFKKLRLLLQKTKNKSYYYVYWPNIDIAEHEYGPNAKEVDTEIELFSTTIERELISKLDYQLKLNTAILITGDHGLISVDPKKTIYLNKYPLIINCFKKGPSGRPILPSGGARDIFLNIEENKLDEAEVYLKNIIGHKAEIIRINDQTITSLFGYGRRHAQFINRLGNMLILPKENHTIWYEYTKGRKFNCLGHHGGLSSDEVLIPLITALVHHLV